METNTAYLEEIDIDSLVRLIGDFLNTKKQLFLEVELVVHILCAAAVNVSVEGVVETFISKYGIHFHNNRNLKEEDAIDKMEIENNGWSRFVKADKLLKDAMNAYLLGKKKYVRGMAVHPHSKQYTKLCRGKQDIENEKY